MRFAQNPATASRVVDGRALVVSVPLNRLFTLNEPASRLWHALENPLTMEDAVAELCRRYQVEAGTARRDCATFLDQLVAKGLLIESL